MLELDVENDEVVRRLSGRRTCKKCGHVWHLEFDPPASPDVCDKCGGELYQRDDDHPETVRHRLEVYGSQTAPLIEFYGERGQLVAVDALGAVEDVTERADRGADALRRLTSMRGGRRRLRSSRSTRFALMRRAGLVVAARCGRCARPGRPGVSTADLDAIARDSPAPRPGRPRRSWATTATRRSSARR